MKGENIMTHHEEWSEFISNMINVRLEEYKKSKEYEYLNNRLTEIDTLLSNELM